MDTPANRMLRWVQLCAACRRGLGYWHAMTMSASHGVAQARYELGDLFGAANEALTVCNHRTTALGERHIDTLTSRLCAVMWQAEAAGLQAHTLENLDFLIGALDSVVGPDHPSTLVARFARVAWAPGDDIGDIDLLSEWEVLPEDLALVRGPDDPLTLTAEEQREVARGKWRNNVAEIRQIAYDLYIDMESEDDDYEEEDEDEGGVWTPGNLDEDTLEMVADNADEQASLVNDRFRTVVAVKRAYLRSARSSGAESLEALQWRYYLAWLLYGGQEWESAARRATALANDCGRLLEDGHPLAASCRELAQYAESHSRDPLPAYWQGDPGED